METMLCVLLMVVAVLLLVWWVSSSSRQRARDDFANEQALAMEMAAFSNSHGDDSAVPVPTHHDYDDFSNSSASHTNVDMGRDISAMRRSLEEEFNTILQ